MTKLHLANSHDSDMFYAVGHHIPDRFFYLEHEGKRMVFLNKLEIDAFRLQGRRDVEVVAFDTVLDIAKKKEGEGPMFGKIALAILETYAKTEVSVAVSAQLPLDVAQFLMKAGVQLQVTQSLFPERRIKTQDELVNIRAALKATGEAFAFVEKVLRASELRGQGLMYEEKLLTAEFLKNEIELMLFKAGYECAEGLIVSVGEQTAFPHHHGSGALHAHMPIIVDLYPRNRANRYFADMTRTYVKGVPSPQIRKMYEAVAEAQKAAITMLMPNAKASDVFEAAAKVFKDREFEVGDTGFIHSLGHGFGLDIHEHPSLSPRSDEVLQHGDVVTIEPGLYYAGVGGVRIEDVYLITESGKERLSPEPTPFIID